MNCIRLSPTTPIIELIWLRAYVECEYNTMLCTFWTVAIANSNYTAVAMPQKRRSNTQARRWCHISLSSGRTQTKQPSHQPTLPRLQALMRHIRATCSGSLCHGRIMHRPRAARHTYMRGCKKSSAGLKKILAGRRIIALGRMSVCSGMF